MSLPKISQPILNIEVPSLKKNYTFRPFLVKEEKILLMAKDSGDFADVLLAIKQIVTNCSLDPTITINTLTIFDLEYIFLKLRSASVNNTANIIIKDFDDDKDYEFEVNLNDVKMDFPEQNLNKIEVTKTSGIIMKHPSASLYEDKEYLNLQDEYLFNLIIRCIDKIYDANKIYESANYTVLELTEFIENLDIKSYEKIKKFLENTPRLKYTINYKNSLNADKKVELTSLNDFFSFR